MEAHLSGRDGRSPRTVEGNRDAVRKYLPDWRSREIEAIGRDRAGVRERHRALARNHGVPTADSVMRVLRAVYARARREHPERPPNRCENVDCGETRRRRVDLDPAALLDWGGAVLGLDPVRRDLHLFLLSGCARRAVRPVGAPARGQGPAARAEPEGRRRAGVLTTAGRQLIGEWNALGFRLSLSVFG